MSYKVFLLLLLGLLTAFGPFVTDMYVPSLPSMVGYFHTQLTMVQLGLTTSMIGLALGQLVFGPISDKMGRKRPLLAAMLLFTVSTVFIIFAPNIETFTVLRFFQGLGGAGGIVISRSVATDSFDGHQLLKMLAVIGAINGIAPIAAPVAGGAIVDSVGWQGIFVVLLVIGVVLTVGSACMKESLAVEHRKRDSMLKTFGLIGTVTKNREFMGYVMQQAAAQVILFGNIASSSFIVQDHYGYSAMAYSLAFAANGVCIALGAALSARFNKPQNSVKASCAGMLVLSAAQAGVLWADASFWVYEGVLCMLLAFMGLTFTASTTLALESERKHAGSGSAVLGAVGFLCGGLVSPLVGMGNIMHSTGLTFVTGAVLSAIFARVAMRPKRETTN